MENYLRDIQDIKKMMDKSSQFLSLSGLSGILAGIYALAGAFVVNGIVEKYNGIITLQGTAFKLILGIAMAVLVLSLATAFALTFQKTKRTGETVWNSTSKRMAVNFLIPLVTGGIFAILLLFKGGFAGLIVPVMLIFYGFSCVNASKYTLRDVRYLGITMIVLGLINVYYIGYGLTFWALGFGVCHIIYGSMMYFKYDRKQ